MPNLDLILSNVAFPDPFSGDVQELVDTYNSNITATTTTPNIMTGDVTSTTAPLTNVGPWMSPSTRAWYAWNGSAYVPSVVKVGNATHAITLIAPTLAADVNVIMPDKSGAIAYRSDVYYGAGTLVLTNAEDMDASAYTQFYQTSAVDKTHAITNFLPGQRILLAWRPTVANKFPSFTPTPVWAGGAKPTTCLANTTDIYYLYNIGGAIYASVIQGFA